MDIFDFNIEKIVGLLVIVAVGFCGTTKEGRELRSRVGTYLAQHPEIIDRVVIPCIVLAALLALGCLVVNGVANGRI